MSQAPEPGQPGEYSFGSGVEPDDFEAQFLAETGTAPAVTALVVAAVVPTDPEPPAGRRSTAPDILVAGDRFVPAPASFSPQIAALFTPPADSSARSSVALVGVLDWRASQAEYQITNYAINGPNRVIFAYSFWWVGSNAPWKIPSGFRSRIRVEPCRSERRHRILRVVHDARRAH